MRAAAVLVLAAFGLGACGLFEKDPPPLCPSVQLLQNADRLILFADGPGRDLTDMRFDIDFEGYIVTCEYDLDSDTRAGELFVELQPVFMVNRGPADRSRSAEVPFFVVLRDAIDGTPIEKANFKSGVAFEDSARQIRLIDEPIDLTIPIHPGRTGGDFSILLGLQLTMEQLEFNRSQGGQ